MAEILKNFIVFEGLDGSGTTTQCKKIAEKISNSFFTNEPSPEVTGQFIRRILRKEISVTPETLAMLFVSDRYEHLYTVSETSITNQLSRGNIVICDRYLFSSIAYQGLNCDYQHILELNKQFPLPEIVFFLNTATSECQKRINARVEQPELFEKEDLQAKILSNYKFAFEHYKNEIKIYELDGTLPIETLVQKELNILKENKIIY